MNLALASRLIPRSSFSSYFRRRSLKHALLSAHTLAPGLRFLVSPPSTFPSVPGTTSVTEAWRDSVYHITLVTSWGWNATRAEMKEKYETSGRAINYLREITPDAAYSVCRLPYRDYFSCGFSCPGLFSHRTKLMSMSLTTKACLPLSSL